VVCPATEVHIRKVAFVSFYRCLLLMILQYTKQTVVMVHETPELYKSVVEPYIAAFPAKRTQWSVILSYTLQLHF
jgi:m7GpppX diphosphatase